MKAVVSLKEVETEIKTKISPDTFEKLKSISPQLHQSFRVLNASFTDIQRKRKGDVCSSLERHFKQFSQSECSEQYLFDDPAKKCIRAEMKNTDNNKQRPQFSSYIYQKTGQAPKRPKGGHITGATEITANNTKHMNHRTRKRVIKSGKLEYRYLRIVH